MKIGGQPTLSGDRVHLLVMVERYLSQVKKEKSPNLKYKISKFFYLNLGRGGMIEGGERKKE